MNRLKTDFPAAKFAHCYLSWQFSYFPANYTVARDQFWIDEFIFFPLQLQFKYDLNDGSHQEICLDNIIFVETNCCKFDLKTFL